MGVEAFLPTPAGLAATGVGAAVSLVFGNLATQLGSGLDSVTLDAVVSEVFRAKSTVTTHPVESGANVADHVRDEPDELQIQGIISNTPVMLLASVRVSSTRAEDEYTKLLALKEAKKPIAVYTPKRDYADMIIDSIERGRTAPLGDSVEVSIGMRRVRIAENRVVTGLRPPDVQETQRKLGRQAKKAAGAAQAASLLLHLSNWLGF